MSYVTPEQSRMSEVKVIVLISAKAGISLEAFKTHYETIHAPLALSLLPMIREYRRNYLDRSTIRLRDGGRPPDFDAITEMIFANHDAYDAFVERIADPEVQAKIRADEALFIDGTKTCRVIVDEQRSSG